MLDKRSFVLGMVTAFSECVAGGCKRLALSPPLTEAEYAAFGPAAEEIVERHGLVHYHEKNEDLPLEDRFHWIVIAARQETIDEYARLRAQGFNPAKWMKPFYDLLSYNEAESVRTGYDAYREAFYGNQDQTGE